MGIFKKMYFVFSTQCVIPMTYNVLHAGIDPVKSACRPYPTRPRPRPRPVVFEAKVLLPVTIKIQSQGKSSFTSVPMLSYKFAAQGHEVNIISVS